MYQSEMEQGTMEAYRTFSCEIALYAYNDYIRYRIDIYCMQNPIENDWIERRFRRLAKRLMDEARKTQGRRGRKPLSREVTVKLFFKELPFFIKRYEEKAEECKSFFLDPHPICGLLGLNGERIIAKADDQVEAWLAGETIRLKKSVRGLNFEFEEDFE